MSISDKWNYKLVELKAQYPWLTNRIIAASLDVSLDRVNSWTRKNGGKCDHAFIELMELKLRSGGVTEINSK